MRKVKDSMGELEIDDTALYQAQTQRAINNFPISGRRMPPKFVEALITIKKAAANTNLQLEKISKVIYHA